MSEEYCWNSRSHEWVIPKPGDLIEISRVAYKHWAVYVGSGYVIHLAPTVDDVVEASANSLMSIVSEKALVKKDLLKNVVGEDPYRINNKYDSECCPLPTNKIVQEAESLLGKKVYYDVATFNCEHFATCLRYGEARSDQVAIDGPELKGICGLGMGTALEGQNCFAALLENTHTHADTQNLFSLFGPIGTTEITLCETSYFRDVETGLKCTWCRLQGGTEKSV